MDNPSQSFLVRHEFLIRRLHSLTGLMIGGYMVVHLAVNASVLNSSATFQGNVYRIHSLGRLLPAVEWTFIFLPIIFHMAFGLIFLKGAENNTQNYGFAANTRYAMQRASALIIMIFLIVHILHMHGLIHTEAWLKFLNNNNLAQFRPFNATSSASEALQGTLMSLCYAVGILACVFHFANGLWTMGITWGVWTSARSQAAAFRVCAAFGVVLAVVGLAALYGIRSAGQGENALENLRAEENRMYEYKVEAKEIEPNEHKRWHPDPRDEHASDES